MQLPKAFERTLGRRAESSHSCRNRRVIVLASCPVWGDPSPDESHAAPDGAPGRRRVPGGPATAPRSTGEGAEALLEQAHRGEDRGGFVAAMGHAVVAARVLAAAELVPFRGLQQFLPGLGVAVVEQVAGLLPAFEAIKRHAPRCALEVRLAFEEVQV